MALAQEARLQHSMKMEPGLERPQSALMRGVQITEFKDACVNPEPIVLEETDILMEQFLSPRKLRLLTGVDNLDDIKHLEMKVNTTSNSLGNFGQYLLNLRQLKVSNSTIPYIRDLGSSLRSLNVLWASRCALLELDGISSMSNLRELYLSYNEITDISPISMLDQLEILDLEGNSLDDIVQVQYLAICSKLSNLTLEGNPLCVCADPNDDDSMDYDYRQAVKKAIPHLKTLDDEILIEGVGSFQKHNVFDADWAYLEELQKDISLHEDSDSIISDNTSRPSSGNRPSTAALKPNTGYRPGTALRPSSGFRPLTSGGRPPTMGARPATALGVRPGSGSNRPSSGGAAGGESETGDASDLTMGRVICGNPSKALLSRRRLNPDASGDLDTNTSEVKFEPKFKHKTEHTYDELPEEHQDRSEIVSELKAWKKQHEKRMDIIREGKAPQVLRIDHDDAVSLSGDSEVESDEEELSPFRPDEDHTSYRLGGQERLTQDDNLSSFVPTSPSDLPQSPDTQKSKPRSRNKTRTSSASSDTSDSLDLLSKANAVDNSFKISSLPNRHKNVIPPPSERDIVRQKTQMPARVQSPLGLRTSSPLQGIRPLNELRSSSNSIRVNSAGLPRPPTSSVPVIAKSRRSDEFERRSLTKDPAQPLIRGPSFDKPTAPTLQRPTSSRAALGITAQSNFRRSLPSVPSLPSKPSAPPK